jgi:hypothetical protein
MLLYQQTLGIEMGGVITGKIGSSEPVDIAECQPVL